jgi:hypothetical protein
LATDASVRSERCIEHEVSITTSETSALLTRMVSIGGARDIAYGATISRSVTF